MSTPHEQSEPVKPFEVYVDGDYIVDFLVPKESIIPFSTKDPTISGLSAEREQMIKAVPGGAWTIDKMLHGINEAWTQWYEELYQAMSSPKVRPPGFVKLRVPGAPGKDSVAPVPVVILENDAKVKSNWQIQPRCLYNRMSLTDGRNYQAYENSLDAADEHWFSWHFAPCPQGSPIDDKTVYRGVGIVAKKKALNHDALALLKLETLSGIPELKQVVENDNGSNPLKAFRQAFKQASDEAVEKKNQTAIDRLQKLESSIREVIPHFYQPPREGGLESKNADHKLFVFMDYDADLRYREPDALLKSIFHLQPKKQFPCRVFIMCSSLPGDGYRCEVREPGRDAVRELFYDALPEQAKAGAVMIVGMDMLRLAGADVAYDQSWDRILDDFYREKELCPELKKLCRYEHLIVRVGVTGAIYHHTPWEPMEEANGIVAEKGKAKTRTVLEPKFDRAKCRLIYDPNAPKSWFRAPNEQGNILGSRSCFGGCVVARLVQGLVEQEEIFKMPLAENEHSHFAQELIVRGIKDAICMAEALYHEGLGNDPAKLKDYTTAKHYREVYFRKVLAGDHESLEKLRESKPKVWRRMLEQELPQRSRYVAHISAPLDDSPLEWGIYRSTLRMGIPEGAASPMIPASLDSHLDFITEQRRLWLAMMVARYGHEFVLNSVENHYRYQEELRRFSKTKLQRIDLVAKGRSVIFQNTKDNFPKVKVTDPSSRTVTDMERLKDSYIEYADALGNENPWETRRTANQVVDQDWEEPKTLFRKATRAVLTDKVPSDPEFAKLKADYEELRRKLQFLACVYPFNAPVAQFGDITVVGQWEAETYSNLRNLLVNHLSKCSKDRKAPRPLSIAVFGGPGSGKSFGVKAIAEFIGTKEKLSMLEFNVSQFANRQDLDSAFLRISDALAKKMIPLVFWDEFDCAFPGGGSFGWLSYFLGPMQDGTYHHPGGALHLAGSIFVFAGGTHSCFREFQDHAMGGGEAIEQSPNSPDASAQIAKERKFPDFISRLRGFLDVPSLNRREPGSRYSPEEREMPYLNRAQTLRYLLKKRGLLAKAKVEDKELEVAQIHPDIIEAFLTVNRYQHGKRSMEALVESCVIMKEELMEASFPTNPQLDMHTWGAEFRERMHLPGSYWITDYLFIPSRVPNPKSRKEVFFPVQEWELVDYCSELKGGAKLVPELLGGLLSKICLKDSNVYLRVANIVDSVEHHKEYLAGILKLAEPEVESFLTPLSLKRSEPFNCYIRPHEIWLDGVLTPTQGDSEVKKILEPPRMQDTKPDDWWCIKEALAQLEYSNLYIVPGDQNHFVIPLAMLEEKQTVNLRLHIRKEEGGVKVLLTSDCARLRFHSGVGANPLENVAERPRPAELWTHQWSWRKMDKARVLRHILKNLYIAVHGENKWKEKEKDMHTKGIEVKTVGP